MIEPVVTAAAGNSENSHEIMELLLDRKGDEITITEEVIIAAAGNWGNGHEVMNVLLDRKGDQITNYSAAWFVWSHCQIKA